ncbi:MAG: thymidylate kinase [Actinobacteria bacterium]|nr:thymidylate kinase [Actinomycetota bacterium]
MNTLAAPETLPASASRALHPTRPIRPTRRDVWDLLSAALAAFADTPDKRAAWQGARGAAEQWRFSTGPADLDIWCNDEASACLATALTDLGAARVQHADHPRRLRHASYAIETNDGLAVIDLTVGDLRVGPVLLVPEADVRTTHDGLGAPVLTGIAAAADRFVRPLLRGRIVDGARLAQARTAWATTGETEREAFTARMRSQLGRSVAAGIATTLGGSNPPLDLKKKARTALTRASLRPASLSSTWQQRHTILPARGKAGVLGLTTKGCIVVLVGTDGSGKSTVAAEIDQRLRDIEIPTTSVYMGMARGNLPGVALARKVLGVSPAGDHAPTESVTATKTPSPDTLDHAMVRRAAAWYYAAEYVYRYWRDIRPGLKNGGVVISDRYVYDLRESPWPKSRASRVAELLMPRPDVLVLPDAPDRLIHARKPERPASEQAAQQARFRELVESDPARTASLTVDTSGMSRAHIDPVANVVTAVVASLHRMH